MLESKEEKIPSNQNGMKQFVDAPLNVVKIAQDNLEKNGKELLRSNAASARGDQ